VSEWDIINRDRDTKRIISVVKHGGMVTRYPGNRMLVIQFVNADLPADPGAGPATYIID
jgi:hypothetical protein